MFGLMTKAAHFAVVRGLMADVRAAEAEADRLTTAHKAAIETNGVLDRVAAKFKAERDTARAGLTDIAAMETPSSAHIGKKMAARARQALPAKGSAAA